MNVPSDLLRFFIVRDHKENKRKCTLSPLLDEEGFEFVDLRHPDRGPRRVEVPGGIVLAADAPPLEPTDRSVLQNGDASARIILIDATWARVCKVLDRISVMPGQSWLRRSIPTDVVTAYPRISKLYDDPKVGLASIEAIFAASVVLGAPRLDLLPHYRWAAEFVRLNHLTFARWGWDPHGQFPVVERA